MITCFIRYEIDPFKREEFETYARNWGQAIPRCGADLIGDFGPHEGSATTAYGVYNIESLAAYETYRARLKADPLGAETTNSQSRTLILKEDRIFLRNVSLPHARGRTRRECRRDRRHLRGHAGGRPAQRLSHLAAQLHGRLERIDGFLSIERFESLAHPGKILSLSFWRDEEAIRQWRNGSEHRAAQRAGRDGIFADYRCGSPMSCATTE